jgi:hypothetical protein
MELYERCIRFVKNVTTTITNGQMIKIKVVHIEKLWNFVVEFFLIWITFVNEKYHWIFEIWKFEIFENGETFKIEVVDLEKLWNFVVYNFFIWNHIINEIQIWISEIWNSKFVNDLEWKNSRHESYRSSEVMKRCSWQLFYLNTLKASKSNSHSA